MDNKNYFKTAVCIAGAGLLAVSAQSYAATATICTGLGNEFQDTNCDYSEINTALGTSFTDNSDLLLIAKDDAPGAVGPGSGGKAGLEIDSPWSSTDYMVTFTLATGVNPEIIVEKFDGLYDVYKLADMGPGVAVAGGTQYTFMRPDHSGLPCASINGQGSCNPTAGTSHVSAYVPIPAAAWLFGSGLIGLAGIARKRKAA